MPLLNCWLRIWINCTYRNDPPRHWCLANDLSVHRWTNQVDHQSFRWIRCSIENHHRNHPHPRHQWSSGKRKRHPFRPIISANNYFQGPYCSSTYIQSVFDHWYQWFNRFILSATGTEETNTSSAHEIGDACGIHSIVVRQVSLSIRTTQWPGLWWTDQSSDDHEIAATEFPSSAIQRWIDDFLVHRCKTASLAVVIVSNLFDRRWWSHHFSKSDH